MEALGELFEPITTNLYEWRIQIAVLSVVGFVVLALVAWRRGWLAAARRHPARAGTLVALALVVGLPLAWYMASPIFIRTALVEAAPVASAAPIASPSTASPAPPPPASTPPVASPTPTQAPFVPATVASGSFTGTDEFHFGSGTASIIEVEPGRFHLRLDDFSVRNGPDLFVVLSPDADGYTDDSLEVGRLKATDGAFGYDLPQGFDPSEFKSALIWCKQFAHLFAVAPFGG